jgi:hypothetical protein
MTDSFVLNQTAEAPAIRVGDVLSKAWSLFFARWAPFAGLALVAFAPQFLFSVLAPKSSGVAFIGSILQIACTSLADAAIIYGVVQVLRGRDFTFGESLSAGFRRMGAVVGLSLIVGVLSGLGALLLLVPGFIVMAMYAVAIPVCVAERLGIGASMKRSSFLTKGARWRIFGLLILVLVISSTLAALVGFLAGIVGGMRVVDVVVYPVEALAGAFNAVMVGVLYYQLRVAKEGVDIEKIAAVFD